MPLSAPVLSQAINSAIQGIAQIDDPAELQAFCDAIAQAIVSHIQANAQVIGTAAVTAPFTPAVVTGNVL